MSENQLSLQFQVIAEYSTIKLNVQHANFINTEYLESKKYTVQLDEDESLRTFSSKIASAKSSSGRIRAERACGKLRVLIDENGKFFRIWYCNKFVVLDRLINNICNLHNIINVKLTIMNITHNDKIRRCYMEVRFVKQSLYYKVY